MKGADSCGMATVLRRVREPRQKSDEFPSRGREQKRVGRSRSIARSPSGQSYRFYPLSGPAGSTLRDCFCQLCRSKPRSRKTSSAAAPVGQLDCRPRATARNAVRDWNSVPVLLEGKAGGFATSEEFLCPCVTSVSTTSNLGLPRSVTSLGQSTSTLVLEGLLRRRILQRRCAFFLEQSLLFPRR